VQQDVREGGARGTPPEGGGGAGACALGVHGSSLENDLGRRKSLQRIGDGSAKNHVNDHDHHHDLRLAFDPRDSLSLVPAFHIDLSA
jgi:hypothetical protein